MYMYVWVELDEAEMYGELCIYGPQNMIGYLGNFGIAKEFIRTGDYGYVKRNGNVFIADRVADLIRRKDSKDDGKLLIGIPSSKKRAL